MTDEFESHLQSIAQTLVYPPTPSLNSPMPRRNASRLRWRQAFVILLLLCLSGLMVPEIRAVVLEVLQIGAVTIYLDGVDTGGAPLNLKSVSGETSLEIAQTLVTFPLRIPPQDRPDRVFVQGQSMVIFVWLKEGKIDRALYQSSGEDQWRMVKSAEMITSTSVVGQDAVWVNIDHPIEFIHDGIVKTELTHFVTGDVLIWDQGRVTYRLETHTSLDEAREFAASLIVLK